MERTHSPIQNVVAGPLVSTVCFSHPVFNLRLLYLEKKQLTRTKIHGEQHSQRKSCSVNIEGSSTQDFFTVNNDKRRCSRADMMPTKDSGDNNRKTRKQEKIEHHMRQYKVWDHRDISTGL